MQINKDIIKTLTLENKFLFTFNYFLIVAIAFSYIILDNPLLTILLLVLINLTTFCIFFTSIYLVINKIKFSKVAQETKGKIISFKKGNNPFNDNAPIIEFTYKGDTIRFHNEVRILGLKEHIVEQRVTVLFNPNKVDVATVNINYSLWYKPIAMLLISFGIFYLDFVLIVN